MTANTNPAKFASFNSFSKLLKSLRSIDRRKLIANMTPVVLPWHGLSRYRTNVPDLTSDHLSEYAKVTTFFECPELDLVYYVDSAGQVPPVSEAVQSVHGLETIDVGNGDLTPEWGVDVVIKGGSIIYGPWTDRQR